MKKRVQKLFGILFICALALTLVLALPTQVDAATEGGADL